MSSSSSSSTPSSSSTISPALPASAPADAATSTYSHTSPSHLSSRLSLPFPLRLALLNAPVLFFGGGLGFYTGAHRAALQFRAENAHRQPRSARGWYFYQKSKNYRAAYGGFVEAVRTGARLSAWATMFVVLEDAVDRLRGRVDALASVVAGLSTAGVFSVWNGFSHGMAVRTARRGLLLGVVYGGAQDVVRWGKGFGGGVAELVGMGGREEQVEQA